MKRKIIIGSRGSRLALWQAHFVKDSLTQLGYELEIKIIKTKGDKIQNLTFDKIEGKGFFTKELEEELLDGDIDMAVHSYKDLPTQHPEGLTIAGSSYREDPTDWILINKNFFDPNKEFHLKEGVTVGTSSPRRACQLYASRPDLNIIPIRGNVPTRIKKVGSEVDAVVLAAAGLKRLELDLSAYEIVKPDPNNFVPAPAQGVLAYQIRSEDEEMKSILRKITDEQVEDEISLEREILAKLEGGCQQPIGIYASKKNETYHLWVSYGKSESDDIPLEVKLKDTKLRKTFHKGTDKKVLVDEAISAIKDQSEKSVFISRDLKEDSFLTNYFEQHPYKISGSSLIEFEALSFENVDDIDWVFFTSKKAIKYFYESGGKLPDSVKIAVMGNGTLPGLVDYELKADFVGSGNDVDETAEKFGEAAAGKKVLFPQAENSLQSIQKRLEGKIETIDLKVYSNNPKSNFTKPNADIMVFTSPMNVRTYFTKYKIDSAVKVVAIGQSTAREVQLFYDGPISVPYRFEDKNLVDVCF